MAAANIREPGSGWPSAGRSSNVMAGASGPRESWGWARSSPSRFRSSDRTHCQGHRQRLQTEPPPGRSVHMSAHDVDGRPITILMAGDYAEDCELTREALQEARLTNERRFVHDGQELMDYLHRARGGDDPLLAPWPGIILLDLNMPK